MQLRFHVIKNGFPTQGEDVGTHRDLYAALLDHGINKDHAFLAALDVLANMRDHSLYTLYGDGYAVVAEAC
jgi:hypothetical protein